MDADAKDFLYRLLDTPSPSGSEQAVQQVVMDRLGGVADTAEADTHGNLILGLNPTARRRVMLAGHCDQIGFMVTQVGNNGYLTVDAVGGIDREVLPGAAVVVHGRGGPVPGVFGKKPSHLQNPQEAGHLPTLGSMWIDVGAADKADAERLVRPGDYVTFKPGVTELANGRVAAPGLDNKAGLFAVLEAFRLCAGADLDVAVYAVSTVQEEVGMRGADTATSALRPDVGLAVDVTFAYDDPASGGATAAPCRLGGGPTVSHGPNTNPVVGRLLAEAAGRAGVAYQPAPAGKLEGNDANTIQASGSGVAAAAVGIPLRNMHTQAEVCALADIWAAARLVAAFVTGLRADTDLRPFRPARTAGAAK